MSSISILLATMILSVLVTAWLIARLAQSVGSTRGRFSVGIAITLTIVALNIVLAIVTLLLPTSRPGAVLAVELLLSVVQLGVSFALIQRGFSLTTGRTFAPFGGLIAVSLAQLALLLLILKPYLVESFSLPTSSMVPTLESGSRFFVNKIIAPRRLDLVVYWNDDDPPMAYCKRLIGLPGERLRFSAGGILINDQPIALPPVLAGQCHASVAAGHLQRVSYKDDETIALDDDDYFFIGDNVDLSLDSRSLGPTNRSSLIGVIDVIYWPASKAAVLR